MIRGVDILRTLRPDGGWAISGDTYEGIEFLECEPFTKAEFEAAKNTYEANEIAKAEATAQAKAALLERLGLTQEEFNTLTA